MNHNTEQLKNELKDKLKRISDILTTSVYSLDIVETIAVMMSSQYSTIVLNNHYYFYTFSTQFQLSIIELSKLLSNSTNDEYRIKKLIADLKFNGKYANIGIKQETLQLWDKQVKAKKKLINHIMDLRNKVYAHTDKDEIRNQTTFIEIRQLIDLVATLINELHLALYNTGFLIPIHNEIKFDLERALQLDIDRIEQLNKFARDNNIN